MKRVHGIERVALIGDSAGGALVTSVAAFATNLHLFKELWGTPGVSPSLREKGTFPEISGVVSLYVVILLVLIERNTHSHTTQTDTVSSIVSPGKA